MRVTRLEVFGFKSFMERLVLPFEGGITGVVGPNGCGKSNIVDALRWVLGETRASNLRGDVLEDIIFNGTDKLRPLGLAEVTISLRAQGENFFEDLLNPQAETELAAILERFPVPANEEDSVAKQDSERKIPHLTVIEGKKGVEESANLEPVLEDEKGKGEPAVATEPTTAETVKNSPQAQTLLSRFSWLKAANEVQITRRLYRSGESEFFINRVPCRLKDIKDLLRAVGLGSRSYTIVAQGEVGRIITAKPEERRLILEEAAGTLGLRDRVAAAKRRLEETNQNLARLTDIISEVSRQVASLKRQAARAEARKEIKDRVTALERALFSESLVSLGERFGALEQAKAETEGQAQQIETQLAAAQAEEEAARATLLSIDVSGDAVRAKIDNIREELSQRERRRYSKQSRIQQLKTLVTAKEEEIAKLEERKALLERRREEVVAELGGLRTQHDQVSETLSKIDRVDEDVLRNKASELATFREEMKLKEAALRESREALSSVRGSLDELQKQIVSLSPLTQLQKTLGQGNSPALQRIRESTKLLADGIEVPAEYAKAVQAVLAERAAFLVADEPHQVAKLFVEEVLQGAKSQKPDLGLGLGVYRSGGSVGSIQDTDTGGFQALISLMRIKDGFNGAVADAVGNVLFAPTLSDAISYFDQRPESNLKIVTRDGEILTARSFYTLRHEGGIIQMHGRLRELELKAKAIESELAGRLEAKEQTAQKILTAEEEHRKALAESQERQAKIRELSKEQGSIKGRLDASARIVEQVESDSERAVQQVTSAKEQIQNSANEIALVEEELRSLTSDDEQQLKAELSSCNEEYAKLEPIRKESRLKLSQCSNRVEIARRGLDELRSKLSSTTLEIEKLRLESNNIRERFGADYGVEVVAQIEFDLVNFTRLNPDERESFHEEVSKLKARIIREGEVDPTSIQQYEEERVRLDDLERQKMDLESAIATLVQTVEELTLTSQQRFLETYEAVRANYERLIPRLFGGGRGTLELTDPAHPLESGVEILVRPPGKKPKSIELLSGGEKALCATALIFSMFLVRPSPLCVLDEVDAPLDDANLVRLLSMIKEMSKQTQFLVITHNKNSMAVADNLVGVTMQEPGATRVITVSLQEAFKAVG